MAQLSLQRWPTLLLAAVADFLGPSAAAQRSAETAPALPTCAVVPAGTADSDATPLLRLLEVALAQSGEVRLVDRERVQSILHEHLLQAATGAEGLAARRRLGELLRADLLVILEQTRIRDHPALRMTVAETHGGLRLASEVLPVQDNDTSGAVRDLLRSAQGALAKYAQPVRQIVAVPPFESDDLTFDYASFRYTYARVVEAVCASKPGILTVELDEAAAIAKEVELTATQPNVHRRLPWYLLGRYRNRIVGRDRVLDMTLTLRGEGGAAPQRSAEGMPPDSVLSFIEKAIVDLLGEGRGESREPSARELETAVLVSRADAFRRLGEWDVALALYEAALLLDPKHTDARVRVLEMIDHQMADCRPGVYCDDPGRMNEFARRALALHLHGLDHLEALLRNGLFQELGARPCDALGSTMFQLKSRDVFRFVNQDESTLELARRVFRRSLLLNSDVWTHFPPLDAVARARVINSVPGEVYGGATLGVLQDFLQASELDELFLRALVALQARPSSFDTIYVLLTRRAGLNSAIRSQTGSSWLFWIAQVKKLADPRAGLAADLVEFERSFRWRSKLDASSDLRQRFDELSARIQSAARDDWTVAPLLRSIGEHVRYATRPTSTSPWKPATTRPEPTIPPLEIEPISLAYESPHSTRHASSDMPLRRWLKCGDGIDVAYYPWTAFVMREPGRLEHLASLEKRPSGFVDAVWDGRHAYLGTAGSEPLVLVTHPATSEIVARFEARDGLPPSSYGCLLATIETGLVCMVGRFDEAGAGPRCWAALLRLTPVGMGRYEKSVDVICQMRTQIDPQNIDDGSDPTLAFNLSYVFALRDPERPDQHTIVIGRDNRAGRYRPLLINPRDRTARAAPHAFPVVYTPSCDGTALWAAIDGILLGDYGFDADLALWRMGFPDFVPQRVRDLPECGGSNGQHFIHLYATGKHHVVVPDTVRCRDRGSWLVMDAESGQLESYSTAPPDAELWFIRESAHYGIVISTGNALYRVRFPAPPPPTVSGPSSPTSLP